MSHITSIPALQIARKRERIAHSSRVRSRRADRRRRRPDRRSGGLCRFVTRHRGTGQARRRRGLPGPRDVDRHLRHGALPHARCGGRRASPRAACERPGSRRRTTAPPSTSSTPAASAGSSTRSTRAGSRSSRWYLPGHDRHGARPAARRGRCSRSGRRTGGAFDGVALDIESLRREERQAADGADARPAEPACAPRPARCRSPRSRIRRARSSGT